MKSTEKNFRIKYFLMSNPSEVIEYNLILSNKINLHKQIKEKIGLHGMEIISIEEYSEETERWNYASA